MRRYDSPLRTDQQQGTRQRILEAVVAELEEKLPEELSFPSIAERARVAERTVYRHFPTREDLMDAFWTWWIAGPFGVPTDEAMTPDEVPDFIARIYAAFDRHEQVSRALVFSPSGREIRNRSRGGRLKMIETTFASMTRRLSDDDRKVALAVIQMLYSITTWQTLRDLRKLSGPEAQRAAQWAARVLIDEVRTNPKTFQETR